MPFLFFKLRFVCIYMTVPLCVRSVGRSVLTSCLKRHHPVDARMARRLLCIPPLFLAICGGGVPDSLTTDLFSAGHEIENEGHV